MVKERISAKSLNPAELKKLLGNAGCAKYRNKKAEADSIIFDSKGERDRYLELKALEGAGEITGLSLQPEFVLQEAFTAWDGRKIRAVKYRADFEYQDASGRRIVEDFKGMRTREYQLKKKLFLKKYPDICFVEKRKSS